MSITETKPREQTMPADALISPWLLLANRDERELPTPTGLKIHRSPQSPPGLRSRHHFCISQLLTRVKARIAVSVLLDVVRGFCPRGRRTAGVGAGAPVAVGTIGSVVSTGGLLDGISVDEQPVGRASGLLNLMNS